MFWEINGGNAKKIQKKNRNVINNVNKYRSN